MRYGAVEYPERVVIPTLVPVLVATPVPVLVAVFVVLAGGDSGIDGSSRASTNDFNCCLTIEIFRLSTNDFNCALTVAG
jgi:hypothetical protein